VLIDHSAWSRLTLGIVEPLREAEIARMFEQGELGVCTPFLLEAGFSARDSRDHAKTAERFSGLPRFVADRLAEDRAIDAQAQLARAGHHRLPVVDLMVAAIADRHEVGILHYDSDYDLILERTDLRFESVWLAPRGTLG
jgi:predicted nucleic acid-binding protein